MRLYLSSQRRVSLVQFLHCNSNCFIGTAQIDQQCSSCELLWRARLRFDQGHEAAGPSHQQHPPQPTAPPMESVVFVRLPAAASASQERSPAPGRGLAGFISPGGVPASPPPFATPPQNPNSPPAGPSPPGGRRSPQQARFAPAANTMMIISGSFACRLLRLFASGGAEGPSAMSVA